MYLVRRASNFGDSGLVLFFHIRASSAPWPSEIGPSWWQGMVRWLSGVVAFIGFALGQNSWATTIGYHSEWWDRVLLAFLMGGDETDNGNVDAYVVFCSWKLATTTSKCDFTARSMLVIYLQSRRQGPEVKTIHLGLKDAGRQILTGFKAGWIMEGLAGFSILILVWSRSKWKRQCHHGQALALLTTALESHR